MPSARALQRRSRQSHAATRGTAYSRSALPPTVNATSDAVPETVNATVNEMLQVALRGVLA